MWPRLQLWHGAARARRPKRRNKNRSKPNGCKLLQEGQIDLKGRVMGGGTIPSSHLTSASPLKPGLLDTAELKQASITGISRGHRPIRILVTMPLIPVLYKYYSCILNVSTGMNYDVRFGQSANSPGEARAHFGLTVQVGFTLGKDLCQGPEFHFNPFVDDGAGDNAWFGFRVGLKYRF